MQSWEWEMLIAGNKMSNVAIFKIIVQRLGYGPENCLLIKELDKYTYKHKIMIPACIENLPSEAKNLLTIETETNQTHPQRTYSKNTKS